MSLAVINLYGNLGHDAELRFTQNGRAMLSFSVASSTYQGSGEQRQEHTDWYAVRLFGPRGEALAPYLLKGTRVAVIGRLQHRHYTRQDGTPGCSLDVIASEIDFSGGRRESEPDTTAASAHPAAHHLASGMDDEDVPF
jgi:single-strand DNA-binding protein